MTAVIIVLIVICGVLAYNLYNINKENENLKISRLKYQKYLEELGYKEYDPYKYRDDDEVYGIQEYDIRPEVKIDGKVYDITNTEYFKNKVELFETRKRFKALIASSEFQSCFLRQIASHFEEQNLKKFNTYLYKEIGTRLGIDEEDSRKLYFEVMEIHPFYYGYSTSSDYSKENRLDDIIPFRQLNSEDLIKITDIELKGLFSRIENMGFHVSITDEAKRFIAQKGEDIQYGARPIKRAIQNNIEDKLADFLVETELEEGSNILIGTDSECKEIIIKAL